MLTKIYITVMTPSQVSINYNFAISLEATWPAIGAPAEIRWWKAQGTREEAFYEGRHKG